MVELSTRTPVFMVSPTEVSVSYPGRVSVVMKFSILSRGLSVRGTVVAINVHNTTALVTYFETKSAYVMLSKK